MVDFEIKSNRLKQGYKNKIKYSLKKFTLTKKALFANCKKRFYATS